MCRKPRRRDAGLYFPAGRVRHHDLCDSVYDLDPSDAFKKRKKELGLYTILGMEKKHISLILCWENWIQTLASLGLGLLLGLVGGRLIWMILLRILNSPNGLPYAFSWTALGWTAAVFIGLFLATTAVSHVLFIGSIRSSCFTAEKQADKPVRFLAVKTVFG